MSQISQVVLNSNKGFGSGRIHGRMLDLGIWKVSLGGVLDPNPFHNSAGQSQPSP